MKASIQCNWSLIVFKSKLQSIGTFSNISRYGSFNDKEAITAREEYEKVLARRVTYVAAHN